MEAAQHFGEAAFRGGLRGPESSFLIVRNVKVEFEKNSNYLSIIIPTESMYTKDRYNVTLFVVCNISKLFFDSNGGDAWNTGSCSGNFVFSDDECFKIIENSKYGNRFIDTLATDLKLDFSNMQGLSARNLRYMKRFAKEFEYDSILQHYVAKLP